MLDFIFRTRKIHKKIEFICVDQHCTVQFGCVCLRCDATYDPQTQTILIKSCRRNIETLICLAHELGHHISFINGGWTEHVINGYNKRNYLAIPTIEEIDAIFTEEIKAWMIAKKILIEIGFYNWGRFQQAAVRGMGSYIIGIYKQKHMEKADGKIY
jgi:hypothetical protein